VKACLEKSFCFNPFVVDLYQRVNSASDDQHQTLYNKFLGGSNVVFSNGYIWKNHRRVSFAK
jgi:hypothetical protein